MVRNYRLKRYTGNKHTKLQLCMCDDEQMIGAGHWMESRKAEHQLNYGTTHLFHPSGLEFLFSFFLPPVISLALRASNESTTHCGYLFTYVFFFLSPPSPQLDKTEKN